MGTLSYDDISNEIETALGNRTDITAAQITRTLNIAQTRIARFARWEELEVTLTNTLSKTSDAYEDKLISLPDNVRDVYSVRVYDETRTRKLGRVAARRLDEEEPANEFITRQMPTKYARWASLIEVDHPPDEEYSVRARAVKWPTAFLGESNGSQTSDLDHKDDMLIALCVNWLYQSIGNYERSGRWWTVFTNMLRSAMSEQAEKPDQDRLPSSDQMTIGDYWKDPFTNAAP